MQQLSCPSCGNPVPFASQATAYAVCDACNSVVVKQGMDLQRVGEAAALQEDGSPLQLGSSGVFQKIPFDIIGRIQVQYPFGFWNEWFAMFSNGNHGWLGEAQGNFFVSFQTPAEKQLPTFRELSRGDRLELGGRVYVVTQKQQAVVLGGEGELPFLKSGYETEVVDLRSETTAGASLDYSENPPLVFLGEYVDFDALALKNLRDIEGWS
jgi:hypothetical protein